MCYSSLKKKRFISSFAQQEKLGFPSITLDLFTKKKIEPI